MMSSLPMIMFGLVLLIVYQFHIEVFTPNCTYLFLNLFSCCACNGMRNTRKIYKALDAFLFKSYNVFIRGCGRYIHYIKHRTRRTIKLLQLQIIDNQ